MDTVNPYDIEHFTALASVSTFKAVWDSATATLSFYYDSENHSGEGTVYDNLPTNASTAADWAYSSVSANVKNVVIDESVKNYHELTSTSYMLSGMVIAETFAGAEYLDVSNVTNMSYMFANFGTGISSTSTKYEVNINSPKVADWDTSKVTNMSHLFDGYGNCKRFRVGSGLLDTPDVSKWNTSNVTDMSYLFANIGASSKVLAKAPDVSGWDTSNVTNMSGMFSGYGPASLTEVPAVNGAKWDTSKVTDMSKMFSSYGSQSTTLNAVPDVSKFNTAAVTNMSQMFSKYGSKSATLNAVPDVSKFNTSNVTNMSGMFQSYGKSSTILNAVPAVSNWNISRVSDMSDMFRWYACDFTVEGQPTGGSTELNVVPDITGWDISTVSNLSNFFNSYGAFSEKLDFKFDFSEWKVAGTTNVTGMFLYAAMNAKTWDVKIPTKTGERFNDAGHWYIGDGTDSTKLITPANNKAFRTDRVFDTGFKAVYHEKSKVLTFYYDAKEHGAEGEVFDPVYTPESGWTYSAKSGFVESVVIDESVKAYHGLTTTAYMFQNMYRAKSITGAEYLDVSKVTDMSGMFQHFGEGFDSSPSTITVVPNVSDWDTSKVTNMSAMFQSYGAGTENTPSVIAAVPDVSKWDTSKVTNMSGMFQGYGCYSAALTEAPAVGSWDTSNVTDMSYLFSNYGEFAPDLSKAPAVGNWNTSKVTNMKAMFQLYAGISAAMSEAPDVSKWDTANVTDMSWLFSSYNGYVTFSKDGTRDESSEQGRLRSTLNAAPDVSNWDTSNVTTIRQIFALYGYRSTALDKVPDVSKWRTSNMTDIGSMFPEYGENSTVLNAVPDVSKWDTAKVTTAGWLFGKYGYHSTVLNAVPDVSKWDTSNVTTLNDVFNGYGATSEVLQFDLDLSKWSVANFSDVGSIFMDAAAKAASWNVTIPATTGAKANDATHWYIGDGTDDTKFIVPAEGRKFKIKATHTHSFTYTANNGKITATCTQGCDKGYDTTPLTLTLTAPASLVYDGNAKAFTFADGEADAWTGAGLELPTIIYQIKQSGQSTYLPLFGTLKSVGDYMAQITVGEKTAQVYFSIEAPHTHNPVKVTGQAATETAAGWSDYYECKDSTDACHKYFEDATAKVDITNLNTWKAQGGNGYIAPLVHSITPVNGKNATDTEAGYKAYYECKNCGKYYEDATGLIEITNIDEWKAEGGAGYLAPLHGTDNNHDHICDYCDRQVSECVDADNDHKCDICGGQVSDHKAVFVEGVEATLKHSGNKGYYKCDCGKLFEDADAQVEITNIDAWRSEGGAGFIPQLKEEPNNQDEPSPDTGDTGSVALITVMALMAFAGILVTFKKKKLTK